MQSRIKLSLRNKYGYSIIDINGNIEFDSVKVIERFINEHTGNAGASIILNLENVNYISGTALNELAVKTKELAQDSKNIYLLNVHQDINTILTRDGLKNFFKILVDEDSIMKRQKARELEDILNMPDDEI